MRSPSSLIIATILAFLHTVNALTFQALDAALNQTFDYIIVGAGPSGLVLANRLSEEPDKTVLVIENGYIDDGPLTKIPSGVFTRVPKDAYNITSKPEPWLGNKTFRVTVANVVGGATIINGMAWIRGGNADYDTWSALGNPGWDYAGLAKYFKKSTHFTPPSPSISSNYNITFSAAAYGNGPVQITYPSFSFPDLIPMMASWKKSGIPTPQEGFENPIGVFWHPNNIDNRTQTRSHARVAYYDPVSTRPNLFLLIGTHVDKLLFDSSLHATGLLATSHETNMTTTFHLKKYGDIILAAGAIFTPQILQISGIGPRAVLEAAGIQTLYDLPGVGENLQDHPPLTIKYNLSNLSFPNADTLSTNSTFATLAAQEYNDSLSGPYTRAMGSTVALLPLSIVSPSNMHSLTSELCAQNARLYLPESYGRSKALMRGYERQRSVIADTWLDPQSAIAEFPFGAAGASQVVIQKPLSRGSVSLNTTHPTANPIVRYNTLQNPIDKKMICELVAWNRQHWESEDLVERYAPLEIVPGKEVVECEEIIEKAVASGALIPSFAHPCCTARMGREEEGGVVDGGSLRVHGVSGVRVVDASLMPLIPGGHLMASVYAVAGRAADVIRGRV